VLLCLLACALWAANFVAVKIGLDAHMTPFLMTAFRFTVASCLLPLVTRPADMPWTSLALIGLVIGVGQFGLATLSLAAGLSAGFAALVLQTQVFFTIGLAAAFLREPMSRRIIAGSVIALLGIAVLVQAGSGDTIPVTSIGLLLALLAAGAAAGGNVLIKRLAGGSNALHVSVWISPFPIVPLLLLSCLTEASPIETLRHVDVGAALSAVLYGGLLSAVGGTAIWAWLLRRHGASRVAMFSPSIPIFAFVFSAILFGQRPGLPQLAAAALVILGLLIASVGTPRIYAPAPQVL